MGDTRILIEVQTPTSYLYDPDDPRSFREGPVRDHRAPDLEDWQTELAERAFDSYGEGTRIRILALEVDGEEIGADGWFEVRS